MRIIAGQFKSRRLHSLQGNHTRPTLDHVKEALFTRLGPWIQDKKVLDLFAGSGSIGLESLSRYAQHCDFIEGSIDAFKVLQRNVESLDLKDQVTLYRMDAFHACRLFKKQGKMYDLIYCDPPYQKVDMLKCFKALEALTHEESRIIYECLSEDSIIEPEGYVLSHSAEYGRTRLDTYRREL